MKKETLLGQKFNRLLVIEEIESNDKNHKRPRWKCMCDCGEITIVRRGIDLKRGNTKSCGCLKIEKSAENLRATALSRRIYEPVIARARTVFKAKYNDGTLQFENFYELSQMNCFYCGIEPSNRKQTIFKDRCAEYNSSVYIYNGVDRVDNNFPHNIDNCVTCCKECNFSKRNMALEDFYSMISNIVMLKNSIIPNYEILFSKNMTDLSQFNRIKGSLFRIYGDIDFNYELFCFILTLDCFYCGRKSSNTTKCKNGDKISHNGLDRIDQSKPHTLNNIVPCCKFCNWSKSKRSRDEFIAWAERAHSHLSERKNSNSLSLG